MSIEDVPIEDIQELYFHYLGDLFDAEHRFLEEQQEMARQATDHDLQKAVEHHVDQTQQHIQNLEQVFQRLGREPRRLRCDAAEGVVSETRKGLQQARNDVMRDCIICAAVIKAENYEMATYRTLLTGTQLIERGDIRGEVENLLEQNLWQEEETAQTAEQSARGLLEKAEKEGHFTQVEQ
jgi:ferritin-like metal-binding protein YciE